MGRDEGTRVSERGKKGERRRDRWKGRCRDVSVYVTVKEGKGRVCPVHCDVVW